MEKPDQLEDQWTQIGSGEKINFIGPKVTETIYGEVFQFKFGPLTVDQQESPKARNELFATKIHKSRYKGDIELIKSIEHSTEICRGLRHSRVELKFASVCDNNNSYYISTLNPADSLWQRSQRGESWVGKEKMLIGWMRQIGLILFELRYQRVTHNMIDLTSVHLVNGDIYLGNFTSATRLPKPRPGTQPTEEEVDKLKEFDTDLRDCQSVAILFYRLFTGNYPFDAIDLDDALIQLKEKKFLPFQLPVASNPTKRFLSLVFNSLRGEKYTWPLFFFNKFIDINKEKTMAPTPKEINPEAYLFESISSRPEFFEALDEENL